MKQSSLILGLLFLLKFGFSQDTIQVKDVFRSVVKEDMILNGGQKIERIVVYSSSRETEDVSKAIVRINFVNQKDIDLSPAVSLPEILKLLPNVSVRKKSNGDYWVTLNGFDNVATALSAVNGADSQSPLVLIDDFPINQYLTGGVNWETIPVILSEIERIEIVPEPLGAYYGPGASNGIIHIITKTNVSGNLGFGGRFQGGYPNEFYNELYMTTKLSERVSARVSGMYSLTQRNYNKIYVFSENRFVQNDSLLSYQPDVETTNVFADLGTQRLGATGNIKAKWSDKSSTQVKLFFQNSQAQSNFFDLKNIAQNRRQSTVIGAHISGKYKTIRYRTGFNFANTDYAVGYNGLEVQNLNFMFAIRNRHRLGKFYVAYGADFRTFQLSNTNGERYEGGEYLPRATVTAQKVGAWASAGVHFTERLHWRNTARYDKWVDTQNKPVFESTIHYNIATGHDIRLGLHSAAGTPFLLNKFYKDSETTVEGTENLTQTEPYAIGGNLSYRAKLSWYFDTELSLFYVQQDDIPAFSSITTNESVYLVQTNQGNKGEYMGVQVRGDYRINRLKLHGHSTFMNRSFTAQNYIMADNNVENKTEEGSTWNMGVSASYIAPLDRFFVTAQLNYLDKMLFQTTKGTEQIEAKFTTDVKASYRFFRENSVYVVLKNLSGSNTPEFIFSDPDYLTALIGLKLKFSAN